MTEQPMKCAATRNIFGYSLNDLGSRCSASMHATPSGACSITDSRRRGCGHHVAQYAEDHKAASPMTKEQEAALRSLATETSFSVVGPGWHVPLESVIATIDAARDDAVHAGFELDSKLNSFARFCADELLILTDAESFSWQEGFRRIASRVDWFSDELRVERANLGDARNQITLLRHRLYGGEPRAIGSQHTQYCSIWGDDGKGGTTENYPQPLPRNCGALTNLQQGETARLRLELESAIRDRNQERQRVSIKSNRVSELKGIIEKERELTKARISDLDCQLEAANGRTADYERMLTEEGAQSAKRIGELEAAVELSLRDVIGFTDWNGRDWGGPTRPFPLCGDTFLHLQDVDIAWEQLPELLAILRTDGEPAAWRWLGSRTGARIPLERAEKWLSQEDRINELAGKLASAKEIMQRWVDDKHNAGECRKCDAAKALAAIETPAREPITAKGCYCQTRKLGDECCSLCEAAEWHWHPKEVNRASEAAEIARHVLTGSREPALPVYGTISTSGIVKCPKCDGCVEVSDRQPSAHCGLMFRVTRVDYHPIQPSPECEEPSVETFSRNLIPTQSLVETVDALRARDANPDGLPYKVEPFSIEEARESAQAHATSAARLRSDPDERTEYTERLASEHERTASTMRAYAFISNQIEQLRVASSKLPPVAPGSPYVVDEVIAQMDEMAKRLCAAREIMTEIAANETTLAPDKRNVNRFELIAKLRAVIG